MSVYRRNADFDPSRFLSQYWQQKPLLLKAFISNFSDPISADELAGLACEEGIESRLVSCFPGQDWNLVHGPLAESRFESLGDRFWTLLVQAVDQWDEDVAALRQLFDFLPSWRLDDVMVSFAARDGGVGAHFDYYDVFLVQGTGQRRWQLGARCGSDTPTRNAAGLSLLDDFVPLQEFVLECGDALYVPARYAHRGVGLSPGLCYSIGLRAPSLAEALEGVSDLLITQARPEQRYADPDVLAPAQGTGEIDPDLLHTFAATVQSRLRDQATFQQWFGCAVTRPRYAEQILSRELLLSRQEFTDTWTAASGVYRHPGSRFAFMGAANGLPLQLFVDGERFVLPSAELDVITQLCDLSLDDIKPLVALCQTDSGAELLLLLLNQGSLLLGRD